MTDEMFIERAKKAIAEHFNSHCKVGGMFEGCEKTNSELVNVVWFDDNTGVSTDTRGIFQVTIPSSIEIGIFYHVALQIDDHGDGMFIFDILKVIGHDCYKKMKNRELISNAIYVVRDTKPGQKKCEAQVKVFRNGTEVKVFNKEGRE